MDPSQLYWIAVAYIAAKGLCREIARWLDGGSEKPERQPPRHQDSRGWCPEPSGFRARIRRWWEPAPPPPPPGFFDRIEAWWRHWTTPPPLQPQLTRPKPDSAGRGWKGTVGAVAVLLVWAPAVALAVFEPDLFERLLLLAVLSGGLLWLIGRRDGQGKEDP